MYFHENVALIFCMTRKPDACHLPLAQNIFAACMYLMLQTSVVAVAKSDKKSNITFMEI